MSTKENVIKDIAETAQLRSNLASAMVSGENTARKGDEKRHSTQNRLPSMPERRRSRRSLSDIKVPKKQFSMSAARFMMRSIDVLAVIGIIAVATWNGYVGINNKEVLARFKIC